MKGKITHKQIETVQDEEQHTPITFSSWLHLIAKESFGTLKKDTLSQYAELLKSTFDNITEKIEDVYYPKGIYNHKDIRANIRKAFIPNRSIKVKEEVIPDKASLLAIEKLTSPIAVMSTQNYYPSENEVKQIIEADKGEKTLKAAVSTTIQTLQTLGNQEATIQALLNNPDSYEAIDEQLYSKTYHYLPYKFDSRFEIDYFSTSLQAIISDKQLEVYFNGDDELTEFKIRCYKQKGKNWSYIGEYVPDFLLLNRNEDNNIKQVIIIETKGEGFAEKFAERRTFMTEFVRLNNEKFGYNKFDFLYIEDTLNKTEQDTLTISAINNFFK